MRRVLIFATAGVIAAAPAVGVLGSPAIAGATTHSAVRADDHGRGDGHGDRDKRDHDKGDRRERDRDKRHEAAHERNRDGDRDRGDRDKGDHDKGHHHRGHDGDG